MLDFTSPCFPGSGNEGLGALSGLTDGSTSMKDGSSVLMIFGGKGARYSALCTTKDLFLEFLTPG